MKKQTNHIPFLNLQTQHKKMQKQLIDAFKQTLNDGVYILGKQVLLFEKEFANYLNIPHAIGVASGTDALLLALRALHIGAGDEVIVPANAYPTVFAVALSGAKIKLVDVDYRTHTLDPLKLKDVITQKTKAIVVVHLYGQAAEMDSILAFAKQHNIEVIEDAAQAHGTEFAGKKVGTLGTIGCFSFYPTKNLGALGDGGMVVTKNARLAENIRQLRMYGEKSRYNSVVIGFNSRLDELQAAILRVKLKTLDLDNKRRRRIATEYIKKLKNLNVVLPEYSDIKQHNFHIFAIKTKSRKKLQEFLTQQGVETSIHYPVPIHRVNSFKSLGYSFSEFPVASTLSKEILSLPCYPSLSLKDVKKICNLISNVLQ